MGSSVSYIKMEETMKRLSQNYVSHDEIEIVQNVETLQEIWNKLIPEMKQNSALFSKMYDTIIFGGSYYDNLKIERPDKFHINLVFKLPSQCEKCYKWKLCTCVRLEPSDRPGWFKFIVKKEYCPILDSFISDDLLLTDKILSWLKNIVNKSLSNDTTISIDSFSIWSDSGPALTLRVPKGTKSIEVDLVPSFKFGETDWPTKDYTKNPFKNLWEFYMVPKCNFSNSYWRASFQMQERQLISGKEKLKPALKLLKKMKKNLNHHEIKSYHLKSIVLNNLDNIDWNGTLSEIFMKLLMLYQDSINNKNIPYYWNKKHNLISEETKLKLDSYQNINQSIQSINENCEKNPQFIASVILSSEEHYGFCSGNPNYAEMEKVAIRIHNKVLPTDRKETVLHISKYLDLLIQKAKEMDSCFQAHYKERFWMDSYYDNLKTSPANTFSIGLVFDSDGITQTNGDKPGWVRLKKTSPDSSFPEKCFGESIPTYLIVYWLHDIMYKANTKMSNKYVFSTSKTAITIRYDKSTRVDLIPSFKFTDWPTQDYRANPVLYPAEFHATPGPETDQWFWRASFNEQERQLLYFHLNVIPAVRLLKKLKENMKQDKISGYCIKTILLNNLDDISSKKSISEMFMDLLIKYKDCIGDKEIYSYWNNKNNLLQNINQEILSNYHNQLIKKIHQINIKCRNEPSILAQVILMEDEMKNFNKSFITDRYIDGVSVGSEAGYVGLDGLRDALCFSKNLKELAKK